MTDNTLPEAREFTMSQYASKDDMIGAMRKRIAELEAQLEALAQRQNDLHNQFEETPNDRPPHY